MSDPGIHHGGSRDHRHAGKFCLSFHFKAKFCRQALSFLLESNQFVWKYIDDHWDEGSLSILETEKCTLSKERLMENASNIMREVQQNTFVFVFVFVFVSVFVFVFVFVFEIKTQLSDSLADNVTTWAGLLKRLLWGGWGLVLIFRGFQSKKIFTWSSKAGQDHGKLALVSFQEEEAFFIPAGGWGGSLFREMVVQETGPGRGSERWFKDYDR